MKIGGYGNIEDNKILNKTQELNKNQNVDKKESAGGSESDKDKVSLSVKAMEINDLKGLIDGLPDIRRDRVEAAKKAVDAGSYNFDSLKVAQKILEEEM
ncbi:MAG: flagellar biosynthesis anti-sigma factor FlgM [Nitrospirota bacterium]|nr:flagellar biosynthesis anti-sigma factor FlgM [Nitrospirota bacterium]